MPGEAQNDYAPIFAWAREALEKTEAELPDSKLTLYADSVVRDLVSRYDLGSYASLIDDDHAFFAEGAGLITALRLRPKMPKTAAVGELIEVKLQQKGFRWADVAKPGKPLEQQWLDEALIALGRVSAIKRLYQQAADSFQPFRVSGPTRHRHALGLHETLMSGVISLLTDDWFPELDQQLAGNAGDVA